MNLQPDSSAALPPAVGLRSPWRSLIVLAGVLLVEACLLGGFVGPRLLAIQGKRWAVFVTLFVLGALWQHLRENAAEYRSAPLRWPMLAIQIVFFGGLLAVVERVLTDASGGSPEFISLLAVVALAVAWLGCSLAVVAPRMDLAGRLIGSLILLAGFACLAWSTGDLTRSFWQFSGSTTLQLVAVFLQPFAGGPVIRQGDQIIGTNDFQVNVSDACGGFHGIGLIIMLLAGYLWWFRSIHRFPQSLLLFPVGIMLIWLANVLRITALILVGIWISPAIAVEGFHSVAGWIAFLGVGLGLVWTASQMSFFTRTESLGMGGDQQGAAQEITTAEGSYEQPDEPGATASILPTAVECLVPFLALTAITMLTQAFTSGFDMLYPIRPIFMAGVLLYLCRDRRWLEAGFSPLPIAIGMLSFLIWMLLAPSGAAVDPKVIATRDPMLLGQPWSTIWLFFRLAGSTITVPIAEELFFRGFVIRRCISADCDSVPIGQFTWFSFLASSLAFGVLHEDAWLAGTVVGMLFAVAVYSRRTLLDAVVAHATTNALLSGYVLATGSWSQWR